MWIKIFFKVSFPFQLNHVNLELFEIIPFTKSSQRIHYLKSLPKLDVHISFLSFFSFLHFSEKVLLDFLDVFPFSITVMSSMLLFERENTFNLVACFWLKMMTTIIHKWKKMQKSIKQKTILSKITCW